MNAGAYMGGQIGVATLTFPEVTEGHLPDVHSAQGAQPKAIVTPAPKLITPLRPRLIR